MPYSMCKPARAIRLAALIGLQVWTPSWAAECAKVEAWLARAQSWSLGQDFNRMQSQVIRQRVAPIFHDDVMREVWGGGYRALSEGRRADIFSALTRCSTQPWVRTVLATPFSNPPDIVRRSPGTDFNQWQLAIDAVNRTPQAEWDRRQQQQVTKNALGQVLKTSSAWTEHQVFRINERFMEVWENKGSIEQGNTVFLDNVFGRPGAIRVSDAMAAATAAMHQFPCGCAQAQQLDRNLLAYFHDSLQRMRAAAN